MPKFDDQGRVVEDRSQQHRASFSATNSASPIKSQRVVGGGGYLGSSTGNLGSSGSLGGTSNLFSPGSAGERRFFRVHADVRLKKFLGQTMEQFAEGICDAWARKLYIEDLKSEDLKMLLSVFAKVIREPSKDHVELEDVIVDLRNRIQLDNKSLLMMSNTVKESVLDIVKAIPAFKPEWMFQIDVILDQGIRRMRHAISPESSPGTPDKFFESSFQSVEEIADDEEEEHVGAAAAERIFSSVNLANATVLEQLLESQKQINRLLTDALTEKRLQIQHLLLEADSPGRAQRMELDPPDSGFVDQPIDEADELVRWLRKQEVREDAIKRIRFHEFTLDDLLTQVTRPDLVSTGIRLGTVCRIWNAIRRHRANQGTT